MISIDELYNTGQEGLSKESTLQDKIVFLSFEFCQKKERLDEIKEKAYKYRQSRYEDKFVQLSEQMRTK